jgi:Fe-S cluster assembly protein SufD
MISWRQLARERLGMLPAVKFTWPQAASEKLISLEKQASTLVFVDGFFISELSHAPSEVICQSLDQAIKSYGLFLQNRWARSLQEEKDPFYLLNAMDHGRGLFLYIPPQVHSSLHIVHLSTGMELASPKIQITLGKNASLSFVQNINRGFCNGVVDLILDEGASINSYDMALLSEESEIHMTFRAVLRKGSRLALFHATDGAKNVRFSTRAELLGENSSFHFRSLAMLHGQRQAHVYSLADHAAPHCLSHQHVKTVLNGMSRSNFEGKIFVRPVAQKTEAYQLNNHLLLSETASANSKPNLEIFADDVKASHGATFSQLSAEGLFYLRSRGLPLAEAKLLLLQGFCRELIDELELDSLKLPLLNAMARTYV